MRASHLRSYLLRTLPILTVASALLGFAASAHAQQATAVVAAPEPDPPSIFENGYQGLLAGTAVGGSAGYLVARHDDWQKRDWRTVGLGLGIGALAGAGLGISLGIADRAGAPAGRYIARDLSLGATFGALVGAIGGGISAIVQDDAEHVLFGAAIGVVSGAGLGIITGIIEGQTKKRRNVAAVQARVEVRPTLAMTRPLAAESARGSTLVPALIGRF
ncbi:MAG: hypothetical protein ABW252_08000 [Polyangiales bacterium]